MSGPVFSFSSFFVFAGCPVMRPEKEKLHKRRPLRAVFLRFFRAPDSRDSSLREEMIFDRSSRSTAAGLVPAAGRKLKMR
jgi:hypothetical protein